MLSPRADGGDGWKRAGRIGGRQKRLRLAQSRLVVSQAQATRGGCDALASRRNGQCGVCCSGDPLIVARAARHFAISRVMPCAPRQPGALGLLEHVLCAVDVLGPGDERTDPAYVGAGKEQRRAEPRIGGERVAAIAVTLGSRDWAIRRAPLTVAFKLARTGSSPYSPVPSSAEPWPGIDARLPESALHAGTPGICGVSRLADRAWPAPDAERPPRASADAGSA
jgi:hypothetical protein